jgi:hypothetical protein
MSDYNFAYSAKKQALGDTYSASAAKNAYAQFLARTRGARKVEDLTKQYEQQTPKFVTSFAKRNLAGPGVQSGIYRNALNRFAEQNFMDLNRANQDTAGEVRQLELDAADLLAQYNRGLVDIEQQKIADMAQQAAMLKSFKPFIGG